MSDVEPILDAQLTNLRWWAEATISPVNPMYDAAQTALQLIGMVDERDDTIIQLQAEVETLRAENRLLGRWIGFLEADRNRAAKQ